MQLLIRAGARCLLNHSEEHAKLTLIHNELFEAPVSSFRETTFSLSLSITQKTQKTAFGLGLLHAVKRLFLPQSIKLIQIMCLREDQEAEREKTISQDKADCHTTNAIILL